MTRMKLSLAVAILSMCMSVSAQWGRSEPLPPPLGSLPSRPELAPVPLGWLVTESEARAFKGEAGFDEMPALRARAVVPLIDILKPEVAGDLKVKSPFAITVQFRSQPETPIDPATFRLMYGALKIDITSRVVRFITVTKDGFTLDQAQLPAGKHRLTLQVQDSRQRVAERELRVEVE